jgi:uncharacterized protein YegL
MGTVFLRVAPTVDFFGGLPTAGGVKFIKFIFIWTLYVPRACYNGFQRGANLKAKEEKVMKKDSCELVFILDRSGSMSGLESDTIGGFNANLEAHRKLGGEVRVTAALFDDKYELLHDRHDIRAVAPMTEKEYQVGGTTALLDAVGETVQKIRNVQKRQTEEFRAEKVIFVIITDGQENASREYGYADVKKLIEHQQKKHGWEFIFLGANMDAFAEAGKLGIPLDHASGFVADHAGVGAAWGLTALSSVALRGGKKIKMSNFFPTT